MRKIEVLMDSGANDSFIPAGTFTDYPIRRTANTGSRYNTANGGEITTLGEKVLCTKTEEGERLNFKFNVGDKVNKAIAAVSRLSEQNHRIVFDDCGEGSFMIDNETGKRHNMRKKENGDYVIDLIVAPYGSPF